MLRKSPFKRALNKERLNEVHYLYVISSDVHLRRVGIVHHQTKRLRFHSTDGHSVLCGLPHARGEHGLCVHVEEDNGWLGAYSMIF